MQEGHEIDHHISQLYGLPKDADLDFFDANLEFDTPVFIDPFLLKNSPNATEAKLFERFGDYFRYAYDQSFLLSIGDKNIKKFTRLLTFHEPKNIYMGYTENSNDGKGPNLTSRLLRYFLDSSARHFVKNTEYFPDEQYNPISLQLFTDGIGPDGISDITANLIMDYLVSYTIEQADKWGIKRTKGLALNQDGFDFTEMAWRGGGYYELPENPLKPGEPVIFVPRRLLRGLEEVRDDTKSRVFSILRQDTELAEKFSVLLSKSLKRVSIEDIRKVFMEEGTVHYRFLKNLESDREKPYDFTHDYLGLLADKNYDYYFDELDLGDIDSCAELKEKVELLLTEFNNEFSLRDGWKDAWKRERGNVKGSVKMSPQTEPVIGRRFRGMGYAFFSHFNEVTFVPEAGTGNGLVDFHIIYKDCRILIELKLLTNASNKGVEKIPAYIHGITTQLPMYVKSAKAKHAYYLTGQHYNGRQGTKTDHTSRKTAIETVRSSVEADLKSAVANFESLTYLNIDMTPRGPASDL